MNRLKDVDVSCVIIEQVGGLRLYGRICERAGIGTHGNCSQEGKEQRK